MEYELLDTGVFEDDRYFDVFVEYAKNTPEDILIQITICNRGPEQATLYVLPTLWFRNMWSFWADTPKPALREVIGAKKTRVDLRASMPTWALAISTARATLLVLFTENETNNERLFGTRNASRYVKDGINDYRGGGQEGCREPGEHRHEGLARYTKCGRRRRRWPPSGSG